MRSGGRRGGRIAALAAVAAGAVMWAPGPVGGQVAPTVSVLPANMAAPGDVVMFLVEGCTAVDPPTITLATQGSDVVVGHEMLVNDVDAWHLEIAVPDTDLSVVGVSGCAQGPADTAGGLVDVEHSILFPIPIAGAHATGVAGTDCPPGAEPEVGIVQDRVQHGLVPTAPDAEGDWTAAFPDGLRPGPIQVRATCGDVVYAPLDLAVPGAPATTVPGTASTTPAGPSAAPATPVVAPAQLTG